MKLQRTAILLAINVLSVLLIIVIGLFPSTLLQIILAIPFIAFFPGYTLMAALFPKKGVFDSIEKFTLSCGLSITIIAFIGFLLNYTPLKINLNPILLLTYTFILFTSLIGWGRWRRLGLEDKTSIDLYTRTLFPSKISKLDKGIVFLLAFSILALLGTLGYTATQPKIWKPFTVFHVLTSEGKAQGFTTNFVLRGERIVINQPGEKETAEAWGAGPDEMGKVKLNIENQERRKTAYRIRLRMDGQDIPFLVNGKMVTEIGPVTVPHEGKWEQEVGYLPPKAEGKYTLEFILFKGDLEYRRLHLFLTVI